LDARTLALQPAYSKSFPVGVVQVKNEDIRWVQERTTAKQWPSFLIRQPAVLGVVILAVRKKKPTPFSGWVC
jgi:hypothetical protein